MGKSVDGIYDKDPAENPDAKLVPGISYAACLSRSLRAIDLSAIILLKDNHFPCVRVFKLDAQGDNLLRVLAGDTMGTTLYP
jgi:uridylate kinase